LPCLWDLSSEDYRDRAKRREGWASVSRMLIDQFDSKEEAERLSIGEYLFPLEFFPLRC
uniref:MADF domain-containing protein n=1 Tax=Gongylonema pulchrum TaxID=637853 RepID=A0A183DH17_9BILA